MYVVLTVTGFEKFKRGWLSVRERRDLGCNTVCVPRSSALFLAHSEPNRPTTDPTPLIYSGNIYTTYSADTQRGIKLAITPLP